MQQTLDEIRDAILQRGLYDDGRPIYAEKYRPYFSPTGLWQQPDELAGLLHYLQQQPISSFLNIGTFNGNTFNFMADFLTQNNPNMRCVTVDNRDWGAEINPKYQYVIGTSRDFIGQTFDLVFIDGDHSYITARADFNFVGRTAKFCALHDIADSFIRAELPLGGCVTVWNELKKEIGNVYDTFEFIATEIGRAHV
jgi:hypothetical protein